MSPRRPAASIVVALVGTLALGASLSATSATPSAATPSAAGPSAVPPVAVVDPAPTVDPAPALLPAAPAALEDTFNLHSNEGADRVILLDFDGATVSGTAWNAMGLPDGAHPAWDPGGDGAAFNDTERQMVQEVWRRVAEDFAPFDVDVTTEEPGDAALHRVSSGDQTYGMRVLITPDGAARTQVCGGVACGGIAYVDVFSTVGSSTYQPAWVFPQTLGPNSAAFIAEATSHEVGHTLGLVHDGTSSSSYSSGSALWGPLMGAPYNSALTQWSDGTYPDAVNLDPNDPTQTTRIPLQDDVAIIAVGAGLRGDESGASLASAVPLADGLITSRGDVDTYALGRCTGSLAVQASPAATGPNLDIGLTLLDASGAVVDTADPAAVVSGPKAASGLDATVGTDGASGRYFVQITGVGTTDTHGDYGSLGAYRTSLVGDCVPASQLPPTAPRDLVATPDGASTDVTLTWSAPEDSGAGPVTSYRITRLNAEPIDVPAAETSHTITGLAPATSYEFSVAALNEIGLGATVTGQVTTADIVADPPTAVRSLTRTWTASTRAVTLAWLPPLDTGGSDVLGYSVEMDGSPLGGLVQDTEATVQHLTPGTHTFVVRAVNGVGPSPAAQLSVTVPRYASRVALRAPTSARRGTRPIVRVKVSALGTTPVARGRVTIVVNGRRVATLAVRGTVVSYRLPRLPRTQRAVVVATYLGSTTVATSRGSRVIRLTR